jgi:aldose 1-epimerase
MLGWSLRHAGEDVIAHPVPLRTYVETGEPTGVALLHPWANRLEGPEYEIAGRRVRLDLGAPNVHTEEHGLPIHGLVAGSRHWEVVESSDVRIAARLDFAAWPELCAGFPFPHELDLVAALSDEALAIETTLRPTGDMPVPVAFGFHPYLRLPGLDRRDWLVELPVTSRMALDERMLPTGASEPVRMAPAPLGDRSFDDAFDGLAERAEFAVQGAGRRVAVRFGEGYRFAQVYAPPGAEFISFEPMTAPINPFTSDRTHLTAPGAIYKARFEIAVADA